MCNECGNCTQFCPYASEPCHDKFTLFQTAEGYGGEQEPRRPSSSTPTTSASAWRRSATTISTSDNDLPVDIEALIFTIRDKYSYLFA